MNIVVNEWGVEELTPAQENFLQDAAEQAGCEHAETCDELTVCATESCSLFVCREHTLGVVDCAELGGPHHPDCAKTCEHCIAADARENHGMRRAG